MGRITLCKTLVVCALLTALSASAQKSVRGVVVDSLSLDNMAGVNVVIKNSTRGTVSDINGIFIIMVYPGDTLIFSSVGYVTSKLPVQLDEEIMFVRMHYESIMLNEVTVRDRTYLNKKYIYSPTLSSTKPLPAAGINLVGLTKADKEKRKLVKVVKELESVRIYVAIVNDPAIRDEIIEKNSITEKRYYELLAIFNQQNNELMHSANDELIIATLFAYFEEASREK